MPVNLDCMSPTFQSTLSMRRATLRSMVSNVTSGFQSTLSMRRATIPIVYHVAGIAVISIHALHEESDRNTPLGFTQSGNFNPRSP